MIRKNKKGRDDVNKKNMIIGLLMVMTLVLTSTISFGALEDEPSEWAIEEVGKAMDEALIPSDLQERYQTPIKRYEYVLIALEILEKNNEEIDIINRYPFDDIYGHIYEAEIVKAYNAGLINGYGDNQFKADREISREEIATLVVNLVKKLDEERVISQLEEYVYSDSDEISSWAVKNINYCYANKIINGIGKNAKQQDTIDPKGSATIEQSILLMYRLAAKENILSGTTYSALDVVNTIDGEEVISSSILINDFAKKNGEELAKEFIDIQKNADLEVTELDKNTLTLTHKDGSELSFLKSEYQIDLGLNLNNLDNTMMVEYYKKLTTIINDSGQLSDIIEQTMLDYNTMASDENVNVSIGDNGQFMSYMDEKLMTDGMDTKAYYRFEYRHIF